MWAEFVAAFDAIAKILSSAYVKAALFVASVIYQQKLSRDARRMQEAAKGLEFPVEGTVTPLPVVYGRALVGGIRVFHAVSSSYIHADTPAATVFRSGTVSDTTSTSEVRYSATSVENVTSTVPATGLVATRRGDTNEYFFIQQAIAFSGISAVKDIKIAPDRFIDNLDFREKPLKVVCYPNGNQADPLIAANFSKRADATFTDSAYATGVFMLNRDKPQYQGVPELSFIVEGMKVRTISYNALSNPKYTLSNSDTGRVYSNSPPLCLLDYLIDTRYGRGVPLSMIDLESFYKAQQICDTIVVTNAYAQGHVWVPTTVSPNEYPVEADVFCSWLNQHAIWSKDANNADVTTFDKTYTADFPTTGTYTFSVSVDDSVSIYLDNVLIYSYASHTTVGTHTRTVSAGLHDIRIVAVNSGGVAGVGVTVDSVSALVFDTRSPSKSTRRNLPLYECNIVLDQNEDLRSNVEKLLETMHGAFLVWSAGTYKLVLEYPIDQSVLVSRTALAQTDSQHIPTITDDKLVLSSVQIQWPSAAERLNFCSVKYSDEALDFKENSVSWPDKNSETYTTMKTQDNDKLLEADFYEPGIKDRYHALAKAEERVRKSRTSVIYKFSTWFPCIRNEPGDILYLNSSSLSISEFVQIQDIKVDSNGVINITAIRIVPSTYQWSTKTDKVNSTGVYARVDSEPSSLELIDSSLNWSDVPSSNATKYELYYWYFGSRYDANGVSLFSDALLGHNPSALPKFVKTISTILDTPIDTQNWETKYVTYLGAPSTLSGIIAACLAKPEGLATFPPGDSNTVFIDKVFTKFLNKVVDQNSLTYYLSYLNSHTRAQLIEDILNNKDYQALLFEFLDTTTQKTYSLTGLNEGIYIFAVRGVNNLGYRSSYAYTSKYNALVNTNPISTAVLYLYKRSATPPATPTTDAFDFTTGAVANLPTASGWDSTIPAGIDPLYVSTAFVTATAPATSAVPDWSAPVILAQNGATGGTGAAALNGSLTKENHTFNADVNGSITYSGCTGTFEVRRGDALVTSGLVFSVHATSNITGTPTIGSDGTYSFPGISGAYMNSSAATITYKVVVDGTYTIYKTLSLSSSKTGPTGSQGPTGYAAALLSIDNSGPAFTKKLDGTFTPTSIALTTTLLNITSPSYQWYKDDIAIAVGGTSSSYTVSTADFAEVNPTAHTYKCIVTGTINGVAGQTRTDSVTIPRLDVGSLNPVVLMSNDNISFTAPYSGSPTFTTGSCDVTAYLGSTKLSYAGSGANTFSVGYGTASGVTVATGSGVSQTYTVPAPSAMSLDYGYLDITVTIRDAAGTALTPITKRITYSVSRAGATGPQGVSGPQGISGPAGNNARSVDLTASTQVVAYNSDGINPAVNTITLTATARNTSGTIYYDFLENNVSVQNNAGNTKQYVVPANISSLPVTYTVVVREGGTAPPSGTIVATDVLTIYGTRPGSNVALGVLTNEAAVVSTANDGSGGVYTNAGGIFNVYNGTRSLNNGTATTLTGTESLTFAITGAPNWITISAGGTYAIVGANIANNTDNYYADLVATYTPYTGASAVTITKRYMLSKSKVGVTGPQGATGGSGSNARSVDLIASTQVIAYTAAGNTPSPSSISLTATARNTSGTPTYVFEEWNGASWVQLQSGVSNILSTYNVPSTYAGSLKDLRVRVLESAIEVATDFISLIGTKPAVDGVTPIVSRLTNPADVVATNYDGTGGDYSAMGGKFEMYSGTTLATLTNSSIQVTAITSGLELRNSANTIITLNQYLLADGVFKITALTGIDTGSVTLAGTYNGVTQSLIYTISKSKAGIQGISGTPGATGAAGTSYYLATVYCQQSATPNTASGGTYNFSSASITAVPTSSNATWSATQPTVSTTPTWATTYMFSTNTPGAAVSGGTWTPAIVVAQKGADGASVTGPRGSLAVSATYNGLRSFKGRIGGKPKWSTTALTEAAATTIDTAATTSLCNAAGVSDSTSNLKIGDQIEYTTQPGGVNWSQIKNSLEADSDLYSHLTTIVDATYFLDRFVYVGTNAAGGNIAYTNVLPFRLKTTDVSSIDSTVRATLFGTSAINGVASNGTRLVVIANDGKMAYSLNAIDWNAITVPLAGTPAILAVAYGNDKWVAASSGSLIQSTDALSWSSVGALYNSSGLLFDGSTSDRTLGTINDLLWVPFAEEWSTAYISTALNPNGYWVMGTSNGIYTSTDLVTWTKRATGSTINNTSVVKLCAGSGRVIAINSSGAFTYAYNPADVWYGIDAGGAAVANTTKAITALTPYAFKYINKLFVVAFTGGYLYTSSDLITWTSRTVNFSANSVRAVTYGNELLVIAGASGKVAYSECLIPVTIAGVWNGTSWQDPGTIIDGNLLVKGSVTSQAMSANSITAENGAIADLAVKTLKINNNAVTVASAKSVKAQWVVPQRKSRDVTTLSRTSGVTTVTTTTTPVLTSGEWVTIESGDSSFTGTFLVTSVNSGLNKFTFDQPGLSDLTLTALASPYLASYQVFTPSIEVPVTLSGLQPVFVMCKVDIGAASPTSITGYGTQLTFKTWEYDSSTVITEDGTGALSSKSVSSTWANNTGGAGATDGNADVFGIITMYSVAEGVKYSSGLVGRLTSIEANGVLNLNFNHLFTGLKAGSYVARLELACASWSGTAEVVGQRNRSIFVLETKR